MKNRMQTTEISPKSQSLSAAKVDAFSGNQAYLLAGASPRTNIDENVLANMLKMCREQKNGLELRAKIYSLIPSFVR